MEIYKTLKEVLNKTYNETISNKEKYQETLIEINNAIPLLANNKLHITDITNIRDRFNLESKDMLKQILERRKRISSYLEKIQGYLTKVTNLISYFEDDHQVLPITDIDEYDLLIKLIFDTHDFPFINEIIPKISENNYRLLNQELNKITIPLKNKEKRKKLKELLKNCESILLNNSSIIKKGYSNVAIEIWAKMYEDDNHNFVNLDLNTDLKLQVIIKDIEYSYDKNISTEEKIDLLTNLINQYNEVIKEKNQQIQKENVKKEKIILFEEENQEDFERIKEIWMEFGAIKSQLSEGTMSL